VTHVKTYERPAQTTLELTPFSRRIFCNRTLNMRSIKAIGYDMDYTLVHYNVDAWEGRAYAYIKLKLLDRGWPVHHLEFDPMLAARGLVVDLDKGNLVKFNNFGYVKRAAHGAKVLEYRAMRRTYSRTIVDLGESRYRFLNTLFAISEACMYMQLVDMFDQGLLDEPATYAELYWQVRSSLDLAHLEGQLKAGIIEDPETYIDLDPDIPMTLLDQREAGKTLLLITNSEWEYTRFMMEYCFDRFLPETMTWRDLFDLNVVSARKPVFFTERNPFYKIEEDYEVDGHTLLKPVVGELTPGAVYHNGSAQELEEYLGCSGDEILYVGDHIFTDVNVSKSIMRWRTALILRELEEEAAVILNNQELQSRIDALMERKIFLEGIFSRIRLDLQRIESGYGEHSQHDASELKAELKRRRAELVTIDEQIAPLVDQDGRSLNPNWGYLMRTGKDKSMLTKQVERYADIYTSRVSNFKAYTPFMYFRSARTLMPHDMLDSRNGSFGEAEGWAWTQTGPPSPGQQDPPQARQDHERDAPRRADPRAHDHTPHDRRLTDPRGDAPARAEDRRERPHRQRDRPAPEDLLEERGLRLGLREVLVLFLLVFLARRPQPAQDEKREHQHPKPLQHGRGKGDRHRKEHVPEDDRPRRLRRELAQQQCPRVHADEEHEERARDRRQPLDQICHGMFPRSKIHALQSSWERPHH